MTEQAAGLLQAVFALTKAAEAEFQGNRYYLIANEIASLAEHLPPGSVAAATGAATADFAAALGAVQKCLEAELSGNKYYGAANRIAVLASFIKTPPEGGHNGTPAAHVLSSAVSPSPAGKVEAEDIRQPGPSFNELAAASKARVQEVAGSLGIPAMTHQATAPVPAEAPETLADGELERRSSEPCAMAELSPVPMEPLAAAAISTESASASLGDGPEADLGSQTFASEPCAVEGAASAAAPEIHAETAFQATPPGDDRKAGSAREALVPNPEASPKSRKTLFNLWLDLMFGRNN